MPQPPPISRKILKNLAKMSHSYQMTPPHHPQENFERYGKREIMHSNRWTRLPVSSPNITIISMLEYAITMLCEIYKNNFLSFNNVPYINSTIISCYEKNCLPIFNINAIKCGPNLFFQSFLLFYLDYYSVSFPIYSLRSFQTVAIPLKVRLSPSKKNDLFTSC